LRLRRKIIFREDSDSSPGLSKFHAEQTSAFVRLTPDYGGQVAPLPPLATSADDTEIYMQRLVQPPVPVIGIGFIVLALLFLSPRAVIAQGTPPNCYSPSDHDDIRLWEGPAPGAPGDDPCRDIPFVRVYRAKAQGQPLGCAVLLIPGGGYDHLSDTKEQAPVAEYFSQKLNLTTFILYYRLVQADGTYRYPVPMWDGQRALKLIRNLGPKYRIDPRRIGVFGFSAGGHLATMLALHSGTDFDLPQHDSVDAQNGRPDFLGLGYPVISMNPAQFAARSSRSHLLYGYRGQALEHLQNYLSGQENVHSDTSPVFLFESMDDRRISPQNSVLFAQALQAAKVPAEIHLFAHGIHGAGLAGGIPDEQAWPELFHKWLIGLGFLQ
jgi:acetyl esterase/lipase